MNLQQIKKMLNDNPELVFEQLGMDFESFSDNIYCTCPVHEGSDNKRAFSFSPDKKIWKCWTRDCQAEWGNDIFGVIRGALSQQTGQKKEFKDALRWACETFNIKRTWHQNEPIKINEDEDAFLQIVNILTAQPSEIIDKPIEVDCGLLHPSEYFVGRGFKKRTIKHFEVGDCHEKGIMKERAVIPIHNDSGTDIIATIGRSIKEYKLPKFLFYPTGFNKRNYFYNFHRASKRAIETSCLYILEGQGDVWKMYEAGVKNAVSIFGKTITQQQEQKLAQLPVTHLIILTDNDQAGRESKVQIKRQLSRMYKLTFPEMSSKDIGDMNVKDIKSDILNNLKGTY